MKTADILICTNAVYGLSAFHPALSMGARAELGTWEKVHKMWSFARERADSVVALYRRVFGDQNVTVHVARCHVSAINARSQLDASACNPSPQPQVQPEPQPEVQPREYSQADFVRALLEAERDLYQRRIEDIDAKLLAMSKPVLVEEIETVEAQPVQPVQSVQPVQPVRKSKAKTQRKPVACPF